MPKLCEYFGIIVMFYANKREPGHVHGKYQGFESRAEIIKAQDIVQKWIDYFVLHKSIAPRTPWPWLLDQGITTRVPLFVFTLNQE